MTLGEATKFFFNDIKFAMLLLMISFFTYGLYSFVTNIVAASEFLFIQTIMQGGAFMRTRANWR